MPPATTAARLLAGVCSRRRRANRQAKLADSGNKTSKSSIFRLAGVLQLSRVKRAERTERGVGDKNQIRAAAAALSQIHELKTLSPLPWLGI